MPQQNDDFLKKLFETFRVEADEHLKAMSAGLVELEKNPVAGRYAEIVEQVFRELHSLKGAARAVNHKDIEQLCHPLESVLAALKHKRLAVTQPLLELLYQSNDTLAGMLVQDASMPGSRQGMLAPLIRRLDDALQGGAAQPPAAPFSGMRNETAAALAMPLVTGLAPETVRVSTQKLDAVLRQVEELLTPRLAAAQRAQELRIAAASFAGWKKQRAHMRPALRLIERQVMGAGKGPGLPGFSAPALIRLLAHLEDTQLFMRVLEERLRRLGKSAEHDRRILAGMSDNLLHDVKEMHLLPCSSLLETFPRFVRELARDQGKQIALVLQGGEIEIDRRILEEMKAPLIHLLRNCIDHGIEQPAVRQARGKTAHGTLTVAVAQKDGGKIEIRVADDGAGIDAADVKTAACKLGLVSAGDAEKLSIPEAQALIFRSGISTSRIITDVSGRGLGLAIVLEKVERLGGTIALASRDGLGATFCISLPLMLAIFRGVLVRLGEQCFVIPALGVERVMRVAQQDISTVENRATVLLDGQVAALADLGCVLALPHRKLPHRDPSGKEKVSVVVLGAGMRRIAFRVDEILGEQEVLVKPLGPQLARVRNVAGASVLGTGQVVAVLNVADLLMSALGKTAPAKTLEVEEKQAILVVEDSITSRALLKNILESAGYRISTAVDGVDACSMLKTGAFDLIVSDVEMPRMDGFDLTARVRADKRLCGLPVVLVTALESGEHRERGIDVGANAYIVKSSFDQSNLLEVIGRLI